jgi:carboxymethylenebutenolidase
MRKFEYQVTQFLLVQATDQPAPPHGFALTNAEEVFRDTGSTVRSAFGNHGARTWKVAPANDEIESTIDAARNALLEGSSLEEATLGQLLQRLLDECEAVALFYSDFRSDLPVVPPDVSVVAAWSGVLRGRVHPRLSPERCPRGSGERRIARMQTREIDIATPDGAMSAYEIIPEGAGRRPAIVFLMDGLGYRAGLKAMAERLASHGYHVLLPDLYHRVGKHVHFEPTVMTQPDKMGEMRKLIGSLTPDMLMSDVAACLDVLASRAEVDATRIGAVGYCMGGRIAFIAATRFPGRLRATASIHAGGIVTADPASPHLAAGQAQARMYFGVAKDDMFFTKAQAETLGQTLAALGKRYEIEHYEARHGWAVIDTPVYDAAEAERHWRAILALFGEELGA